LRLCDSRHGRECGRARCQIEDVSTVGKFHRASFSLARAQMGTARNAAWIDRTNDGLSGMLADGICLPLKRDFGMSRWVGSKARLYQPREWAEGGRMTAHGTKLPYQRRRPMSEVKGRTDSTRTCRHSRV
jgi:hypothetical protein